MKNLLSIGVDAKTVKGEKIGYMTGILYLAPSNSSGYEMCMFASPGCKAACLFTAGRGAMSIVKNARIQKTIQFATNTAQFMAELDESIRS